MTIIADATALILLSKIGILEIFADRNDVIIPTRVYEEVIRGKEKGRDDSLILEKLTKQNKLDIQKPREAVKKQIENTFGIKKGELEVISLAYGTSNVILTDDKKCLNVAKSLGLSFITSLDVVIVLWKKKAINKEKAIECVDQLEEYGWYSKELIKIYREVLK